MLWHADCAMASAVAPACVAVKADRGLHRAKGAMAPEQMLGNKHWLFINATAA